MASSIEPHVHKFDPAHKHRLTDEEREQWQPVTPLLDLLEIHRGGVYADVGCGPGYYTIPLAQRAVGGTVHAVDVLQEMLDDVRGRAAEAGVAVVPVLSGELTIPLEDGSQDGVLCVNVLHEPDDAHAFLVELHRILRPGGRLVLVDWAPGDSPHGPPQEARWSLDMVRDALAAAGFRCIRSHPLYRYHHVVTAS